MKTAHGVEPAGLSEPSGVWRASSRSSHQPRWTIGDFFDDDTLAAWGDVDLLRPASGGVRNAVWFAHVNGAPCVVRRSKRADAALVWELDVIEAVRNYGLGAPALIPTTAGERSFEGVVVHERVDGRPPVSHGDWAAVAEYLATLHSRLRNVEQRPGFRSSVDLLATEAGGDVDLSHMPNEAGARCRAAWARLRGRDTSLIHGDPGKDNILVTAEGVVLVDWDESRVDAALLDLAALPEGVSPLDDEERWVATQAASAWGAAVSWRVEPDYARKRLAEVAPAV